MLKSFNITTVLFFGTAGISLAATQVVGKNPNSCPNAKYTTIGAAVNAAAAGDEIEVCPGLYPEQLTITKPLTLRGMETNGLNMAVLQPTLSSVAGLPFQAVIAVVNTAGVSLQNLTIDASQNTVSGCNIGLAGVHFYNASGALDRSTVFGAQLKDPLSCKAKASQPGNGFGIMVDTDGANPGPFRVFVTRNSVHDFNRSGIAVSGSGVTAEIDGNHISGVGPSIGVFQFAISVVDGAVGLVTRNMTNLGLCGPLSIADCINLRSEGIVLRAAGEGTIVDGNTVTNAQSGIFANGGRNIRITNNVIRNIEALSGINIQGSFTGFFSDSVIEGNVISNVGPIDDNASENYDGCGINAYSETGVSGNVIRDNTVINAYCGVAYVSADFVGPGHYFNTLYSVFNADLYPDAYPPAKLP